MYLPQAFAMTDEAQIIQLMQAYSFATLIHIHDGMPTISHVPLYVDETSRTLIGHLARQNPHAELLDLSQASVIFQGPHDYIATTAHASTQGIPTWNYAVVHVHGTCRVIHDDARILDSIEQLLHRYEDTPLNVERFDQVKQAIVFFEITLDQVEAKFKLSQNRPIADQLHAIADLQHRNPALADLMQQVLFDPTHPIK